VRSGYSWNPEVKVKDRSRGAVLLARSGKTQAVVAQRLKVTEAAVSLWVAGTTRPRAEKRSALFSWLRIPVDAWDEEYAAGDATAPRDVADDDVEPLDESEDARIARLVDDIWHDESATPLERAKVLALVETMRDKKAKRLRAEARHLTQLPEWERVRQAIREALSPHPEALRALEAHLERIEDERVAS